MKSVVSSLLAFEVVAPTGAVLHRSSGSFKRFICTLFEKLNSNWHEISISPHNCDRSLWHWFFHCLQENATLFGRMRKATGRPIDRFIALYYFHSAYVHGVVELSFSNKFFSDLWLLYVFKVDRTSISCKGSLVTSARVTLHTHKSHARVKKENNHGGAVRGCFLSFYERNSHSTEVVLTRMF